MPRVVAAGVPMRMPLGRNGGLGSSGITCLLQVIAIASKVSSATRPLNPKLRTQSTTIMWFAVPPVTKCAPPSKNAPASAWAFDSTCWQ